MTVEVFVWMGLGVLVIAAIGGAVWYTRGGGAPSGPSIDPDDLERQLETLGIDTGSNRIPNLEIIAPYIHPDASIVAATRGKSGPKRALLVLLDDQLVAAEATVADYGADVRTLALEAIETFEQSYDIGGEFRFESGGEMLVYTHIPRSQTSDFANAVRDALQDG